MRAANILLALLVTTFLFGGRHAAVGQVVGHTTDISGREIGITLELADGKSLKIVAQRGTIQIDGEPVGRYPERGTLEQRLRALVSRSGRLESEVLVEALRALPPDGLAPAELETWQQVVARLPAVQPSPEGQALDPALYQPLAESEAVAAGASEAPLRPPASTQQEADTPRALERVGTNLLSLLGSLAALAALGFGALFLVPDRMETVAATVARVPFRCFLVGLCAQPLILPALATLLIALVLTVVGILLIPVAVVLFASVLATAVIGGYVAVARVVGELYAKRGARTDHYAAAWTAFRYLMHGLLGLLAIWLPAALLSWIPLAGALFVFLAAAFTWIMATAGLGAVLLSRGGTRSTFAPVSQRVLASPEPWREPLPR